MKHVSLLDSVQDKTSLSGVHSPDCPAFLNWRAELFGDSLRVVTSIYSSDLYVHGTQR